MPKNAEKKREVRLRRQEEKMEREARAVEILKNNKFSFRDSLRKKKSGPYLLNSNPLLQKLQHLFIRNPEEWESKHYNIQKQYTDFIKWVLCKYSPPYFLLRDLFLHDKKRDTRTNEDLSAENVLVDWFVGIVTGQSFAKISKDHFTKKEAHLFLTAPRENTAIQNIWWTLCKAQNIPDNLIKVLLQKKGRGLLRKDSWWREVITFLGKVVEKEPQNLTSRILQDLVDFFDAIIGIDRYLGFTFSGRTLSSIIRLSNEWHRTIAKAKFTENVAWRSISIPVWVWKDEEIRLYWGIMQLTNSDALYREGQAMHHCVYSYVSNCFNGRSAIFSMKTFYDEDCTFMERRRATIELDIASKTVVQVKRKLNTTPSVKEYNIIAKWANIHGLKMASWL